MQAALLDYATAMAARLHTRAEQRLTCSPATRVFPGRVAAVAVQARRRGAGGRRQGVVVAVVDPHHGSGARILWRGSDGRSMLTERELIEATVRQRSRPLAGRPHLRPANYSRPSTSRRSYWANSLRPARRHDRPRRRLARRARGFHRRWRSVHWAGCSHGLRSAPSLSALCQLWTPSERRPRPGGFRVRGDPWTSGTRTSRHSIGRLSANGSSRTWSRGLAESTRRGRHPDDITAGMAELGIFGVTIPEEYGGCRCPTRSDSSTP